MQALVSVLLGVLGAGLVALALWGRRRLVPVTHWRGFVADAACVLALALLIGTGLFVRILWVRSFNGQVAFEYIQQVVAQQQAQVQKIVPPPKPTP